jgi:RimJ/RimL family protein N-acetyltransferase
MDVIEVRYGTERRAGTNARAETWQRRWDAEDGTRVLLRQIQPSDFDLERDFIGGLSRSTRYLRLMSGRSPSADEIYHWTHIDRQYEGAVIATVSVGGIEQQVGVARYVAMPGENEAELAIVISDAWQGKGLGTQLLSSLIDLARQSGMKRLFGTTLSENNAMIGLGRRLGFKMWLEPKDASITNLVFDLRSGAW